VILPARVPAPTLRSMSSSYEYEGLGNIVVDAKRLARPPRLSTSSQLSRASTAEVFVTGLGLDELEASPRSPCTPSPPDVWDVDGGGGFTAEAPFGDPDVDVRLPLGASLGSLPQFGGLGEAAPANQPQGVWTSPSAARPPARRLDYRSRRQMLTLGGEAGGGIYASKAASPIAGPLAVTPPPGLSPQGILSPARKSFAAGACASSPPPAAPQVALTPPSAVLCPLPSANLCRETVDAAGQAVAAVERALVTTAVVAQQLSWLSVGSKGHPLRCSTACRYIKKKGGCREGANCPNCHVCYWRRDAEQEREDEALEQAQSGTMGTSLRPAVDDPVILAQSAAGAISIGTLNHPHDCGQPCRYVRRREGCRDGASCPHCHACLWRRVPRGKHSTDQNDEDSLDGQHARDAPKNGHLADVQGAELGADRAPQPERLGSPGRTLEGLIRLALHGGPVHQEESVTTIEAVQAHLQDAERLLTDLERIAGGGTARM